MLCLPVTVNFIFPIISINGMMKSLFQVFNGNIWKILISFLLTLNLIFLLSFLVIFPVVFLNGMDILPSAFLVFIPLAMKYIVLIISNIL